MNARPSAVHAQRAVFNQLVMGCVCADCLEAACVCVRTLNALFCGRDHIVCVCVCQLDDRRRRFDLAHLKLV